MTHTHLCTNKKQKQQQQQQSEQIMWYRLPNPMYYIAESTHSIALQKLNLT